MNKNKKDVVANTLITTSDVVLVVLASLCVSLAFIVLSIYSEFVRNNELIVFTLFEVVAFIVVLYIKRYRK
jgi:hypothetical protein